MAHLLGIVGSGAIARGLARAGRSRSDIEISWPVMVVTGALLFYAIPVRSYQSLWFRLKVIALILAGLNAFVFHAGIDRRVAEWDLAPTPPRAARRAGATSLILWAIIVVAGRMIAYNWFDCDKQPQATVVNVFAGCVVPPAGGGR